MSTTYFIPAARCPWAVIFRKTGGEWQFEAMSATRCVARVKAFWLRHTRKGVETRVVRAWIPTK